MHTYFHIVRYHFFFLVVRGRQACEMNDAWCYPIIRFMECAEFGFLETFHLYRFIYKGHWFCEYLSNDELTASLTFNVFFLRFVSFGLLTFYIAPLVPPLILSRFEQFAERAINSVEPSPIHIFPQHSKVNKLSFLLAFLTTLRQRERKKKLISELKEVLWWSTSYSLDIMLCEFIPVTVRIKVGLQIQLSMWIYESSY